MAAQDIAIVGYAQSPSWRQAEQTENQFLYPVISEAIEKAGIDRREIGFTCAGSCDYLSGQTFAFVMNKDKYNQMSDRQKKAIDDNCNTEAAGRVGEPWGKFEDAGVDKVKAEQGHEVYKLTPDQMALWKKASEPLFKTWAEGVKKTGVDPDAAMTELRTALAKYNALTQ